MKKQYIIPIFVPHLGCPNDCVFCNQKSISGQKSNMTKEKAKKIMKMINALKKQLDGCENCPLEKICPEDKNNDFMNKCTDIWFQFFNSKDMVTFYEPMILW